MQYIHPAFSLYAMHYMQASRGSVLSAIVEFLTWLLFVFPLSHIKMTLVKDGWIWIGLYIHFSEWEFITRPQQMRFTGLPREDSVLLVWSMDPPFCQSDSAHCSTPDLWFQQKDTVTTEQMWQWFICQSLFQMIIISPCSKAEAKMAEQLVGKKYVSKYNRNKSSICTPYSLHRGSK